MARIKIGQDVFRALADPTRRQILVILRDGELPAHKIAEHFQLALPSLSEHLRKLVTAGLIKRQRTGREQRYRLQSKAFEEVSIWIKGFE